MGGQLFLTRFGDYLSNGSSAPPRLSRSDDVFGTHFYLAFDVQNCLCDCLSKAQQFLIKMSGLINQKPPLSRRRIKTQEDDTRTQLRQLLTSIKDHKSVRPNPLPRSLNLSNHLQQLKESPPHKLSLPSVARRRSATKIGQLNDFQRHIIGNYLNAHLKFEAKEVLAIKPNRPKKKVAKGKARGGGAGRQKMLVGENTTINQADLDTIRHSSKFRSIENNKEYSLKEEPMKHYVQQRIERKKREWKETCPLELETYFASVKDKVGKVHAQPSVMQSKNKSEVIRMPEKEKVSTFIKGYLPKNKEIRMVELIKKENFTVDITQDSIYFGVAVEGKRQGLGVQIREGYLFEGHWMNGKRLKGYELTENGIYIGGFRDDKKEGKGSFSWINGEHYEGEWLGGKRHGVGMWSSPKGDNYMGEWKKGVVEGEGIHKTHNGQKYQGSFKNFLKHGWGKEVFPNRDRYEGEYFQGLPHGSGMYVWGDGTTYEGDFVQGYRQGKGILTNPKGFNFKGDFFKERAEGHCQIDYGNGETYQGEMKAGKRNGKGTLRNLAKRKLFAGYWKNNEFAAEDELQ